MPADASPFDLVGLGEGMVEFHAEGAFGTADLFRRGFAGDIVNSLIHASRLGLRCALVSRIGDDAFAPGLVAAWAAEGIDLTHAPQVPGENGMYFILTDPQGEREFLYRRAGSAASRIGPQDVDAGLVRAARMLLVSGITQAISESAEAAVAHACALRPGPTVLDPNYRARLWDRRGGVAAARAALRQVCGRLAWVLPSHPADLVLLDDPPGDPAQAACAFAALTGADVALKLGAEGVLMCRDGNLVHVPAVPVEHVIDTTGAGDAWNAAFLHGLLTGADPVQAAARANAHAARKLGFRGAIPPRDDGQRAESASDSSA